MSASPARPRTATRAPRLPERGRSAGPFLGQSLAEVPGNLALQAIRALGDLGGACLIGEIGQAARSFSWAPIAAAGLPTAAAIPIRVVGVSLRRGRFARPATARA